MNQQIVRTPNGHVSMWHMRDYRVTQTTNDTDYLSRASHYEYDCDKQLGRGLALRAYADAMAQGTTVAAHDIVRAWEDVTSGSMLEVTWAIACGKKSKDDTDVWLFNTDQGISSLSIAALYGADGATYQVSSEAIKNLRMVLPLIKAQSGINPPLFLAAYDTENAFAGRTFNQRMIGITIPMLNAIGADRAVLATTVAHELAHLYLGHEKTTDNRNATSTGEVGLWDKLINLVSATANALIRIGAMYVSAAYSRDQEREADKLAMQWATATGFSPCGIADMLSVLNSMQSETSAAFLSSHPSDSERIEMANQAAHALNGQTCGIHRRQVVP